MANGLHPGWDTGTAARAYLSPADARRLGHRLLAHADELDAHITR